MRNPVISTILYLTSEDTAARNENKEISYTGGPSLVTNQKLNDIRLATKGWMAFPKPRRLVAFDGRYLHGGALHDANLHTFTVYRLSYGTTCNSAFSFLFQLYREKALKKDAE